MALRCDTFALICNLRFFEFRELSVFKNSYLKILEMKLSD